MNPLGDSVRELTETEARESHDICTLVLARRLSALLDRDPSFLVQGEPLPRGWHVMLFNPPARQSQLRPDGAADPGIPLPDLGLPRLMFGGRTLTFVSDIPIGARVRRLTRCAAVEEKSGRSGRFAIVKVDHRIFVDGATEPALLETSNYVMRAASSEDDAIGPRQDLHPEPLVGVVASRTIIPDEMLLFRYSAITDNPHRVHYDYPYASAVEGYPALLVNGSIPGLFLLEMLREVSGRQITRFSGRNIGPMFCGEPLRLEVAHAADGWRLRASNAAGMTTFEASSQ